MKLLYTKGNKILTVEVTVRKIKGKLIAEYGPFSMRVSHIANGLYKEYEDENS